MEMTITTKTRSNEAVAASGGGDVYARCRTGSAAGRGSVSGWTPCPLCTSTIKLLADNYSFSSDGIATSITSTTSNHTRDSKEESVSRSAIISSSSATSKPQQQQLKSNTPTKSVKLFSHGRGLSAHLHAVHTPWNPGKAELKRRETMIKRMQNEARRKRNNSHTNKRKHCGIDVDDEIRTFHDTSIPKGKWEPTEEEIKQWNENVLNIVALVEANAKKGDHYIHHHGREEEEEEEVGVVDISMDAYEGSSKTNQEGIQIHTATEEAAFKQTTPKKNGTEGRDRSGNVCLSYRQSLPPFLAAAADGDLMALKKYFSEDDYDDHEEIGGATTTIVPTHPNENSLENKKNNHKQREKIKMLLSIRDRNGSTAEHWAAGGGHWDCTFYLLQLRDAVSGGEPSNIGEIEVSTNTKSSSTQKYTGSKKIRRRRDGKTSLHYAARNGHIRIIDLLLSRRRLHDDNTPHVDISCGDGTTPLHMACYGGHPDTVKHLVETHAANIHALNEWECGAAHWAAMSLGNEGTEKVIELCLYLKEGGANFVKRQKQGHTPLHKAASRKNRHVIEWLATSSLFSDEDRKIMGLEDVGGNRPSDIWLSVGGEEEFGWCMKERWNW
jgi:hypothetical protein